MGGALAAAFALAGLVSRALAPSGAVATIVVGTLAYGFGGVALAAALVVFFLSGSVLSRISERIRAQVPRISAKGGRRDAAQVVANGGAAVACAIASAQAARIPSGWHDILFAAAIGAVAAASGDTWSTEIGTLFGGSPRSLRTGRPVAPGTSGGVTAMGVLGAPLGGAVVGLTAGLFGRTGSLAAWAAIGAACGLLGSLADSWLGATLQGAWRCEACGVECEQATHGCGSRTSLVRGWPWLDNDGVNAVATLSGAVIAGALARF